MKKRNYTCLLFLMLFSAGAYAEPSYYDEYGSGYYAEPTYQDNRYDQESFYDSPQEVSGYSSYPSYSRPVKRPTTAAKISGYGERVIVINPRTHRWAAYSANGTLIRSGMATAGKSWCPDIGRPCRTKVGVFRIKSLGGPGCVSSKFPVGEGGAPMPYCMFFNGGQGIHGSYEVVDGNASHGCVRVHVGDAQWIRYNFATIGTKVIVKPY